MKVLISSYTFNAAAGEISVLNHSDLKLEQLLLITNTSHNKIIYNFADASVGGFVSSNTIYLSADTSFMQNSDSLQIFVEDYFLPSSEASLSAVNAELQKSNTLLDAVTSINYAKESKQDLTNTLLDALTGKQTTINLDVSAINLNTDEIETLLSDANTYLEEISIAGLVGTTSINPLYVNQGILEADADSVSVPGVEGLLKTTNSNLTSINGYTENISNVVDNYLYQLFWIFNDTQNIYSEISNYLYQLGDIYSDTQSIYSEVYSYLPYLESVNFALTAINPNLPSINAAVNDTNITQTTTSALTSNLLITGQRRMYSIFGVSTSTSNQYIHLYDSNNSTPAGTPVGVFVVPANSNFSFDISKGLKFINGCLVTNSLTLGTYSAGANDLYFTVVHTN